VSEYVEVFGYFLIAFMAGFAPAYLFKLFRRGLDVSTGD